MPDQAVAPRLIVERHQVGYVIERSEPYGVWFRISALFFRNRSKLGRAVAAQIEHIFIAELPIKIRDAGDDLRQIANDDYVYVYGSGISEETMTELETLLTECRRRGIHVAGFLPPFAPPVYHALAQDPSHYGYMFELPARLAPLFERLGGSFADFTNPARCDIARDGFYDGQHASSPSYQRLWACWAEADPRLLEFSSSAPAVTTVSPPEGATIEASPTFTWRPVAGASAYRISITRADGDSVWAASVSDTAVRAPEGTLTQGSGTYFWYVDALLADGRSVAGTAHEFHLSR